MGVRRGLTHNDIKVLGAVIDLTDSGPLLPTLRDVMRKADLSIGSVGTALRRLQLRGLVDRTPGLSRSIRPMGAARKVLRDELEAQAQAAAAARREGNRGRR
jgi:DNA-binding MarR family transcriptional regulator